MMTVRINQNKGSVVTGKVTKEWEREAIEHSAGGNTAETERGKRQRTMMIIGGTKRTEKGGDGQDKQTRNQGRLEETSHSGNVGMSTGLTHC